MVYRITRRRRKSESNKIQKLTSRFIYATKIGDFRVKFKASDPLWRAIRLEFSLRLTKLVRSYLPI